MGAAEALELLLRAAEEARDRDAPEAWRFLHGLRGLLSEAAREALLGPHWGDLRALLAARCGRRDDARWAAEAAALRRLLRPLLEPRLVVEVLEAAHRSGRGMGPLHQGWLLVRQFLADVPEPQPAPLRGGRAPPAATSRALLGGA
ncbi:unnamed protein product [Prorocentrum cordatum]|uniref:Uncharacterized protein n=1 Tax=Prorocentrum cordatum TaxID=2364126 RepID=A0ABN9WZQ6_9DINO|nr:unnamed protein product [Polarella glacialis]